MSEKKKVYDGLSDGIGPFTFDNEEFINGLLNDHRTLQSKVVGLMFKSLLKYSEVERFDARNEQAVKLAKQVIEGYKLVKTKELKNEGFSDKQIERFLESQYVGNLPTI